MEQKLMNEEALRISQWFRLLKNGAISQKEYDAIKKKVFFDMGIEVDRPSDYECLPDEEEAKSSEVLPPPHKNREVSQLSIRKF